MTPERLPIRPLITLEEITRLAQEATLMHGEHPSTIIAEGDKGPVVCEMNWMPVAHVDKLRWMFIAGYELAESRQVSILKQVFFICEGWLSTAHEGEPPVLRPALDPERKEVLFVTNLKVEGEQAKLAVAEMYRDSDGRLTRLEEIHTSEDGDHVELPVLSAFLHGFRVGIGGRFN